MYIIENTAINGNERFYGDHYPDLETEKNAWHYPKEQAMSIAKELGEEWRVVQVS